MFQIDSVVGGPVGIFEEPVGVVDVAAVIETAEELFWAAYISYNHVLVSPNTSTSTPGRVLYRTTINEFQHSYKIQENVPNTT